MLPSRSDSPEIKNGRPGLVLAPMEGVTDAPMRAFLTELGGFTYCVSEFLRISQDVPKRRAWLSHIPELANNCRTPSGTPVQIQILGGDPEKLALAASRACEMGAKGIDLNFGCPAPTVNRHDGGATLLKYPNRIRDIVSAVRRSVPSELPVSAKLRLGWDSMDPIYENAEMAAQGGASWITIHGRTKTQGYTPPAYWQPIGIVKKNLKIPVVANGEIWTIEDFRRCQDQTECEHFMIGRSALADPTLQLQIAQELGIIEKQPISILNWVAYFRAFEKHCTSFTPSRNFSLRRIKQWISMINLKQKCPELMALKTINNPDEFYLRLSEIK